MALQSQTTSPITDFGALLRRRVWHILLPFAFITALGVMVAELWITHKVLTALDSAYSDNDGDHPPGGDGMIAAMILK